jgi:hypothetical protein
MVERVRFRIADWSNDEAAIVTRSAAQYVGLVQYAGT